MSIERVERDSDGTAYVVIDRIVGLDARRPGISPPPPPPPHTHNTLRDCCEPL
jgi:hypothetical protein